MGVSRQQATQSQAWPASKQSRLTAHVSTSPHHLYRIITCKETTVHSSARAASINDREPNERQPSHHVLLETQPPINPAIATLIRQPQRTSFQAPEGHIAGERTAKGDRPWTTTPESSFVAAAATVPLPHSAVRASGQINHQSTLVAIFNHAELSLERLMQISGTRHSLQEREHPQW